MSSRIITLTTDFGYSDHFTGAMKGVILSIAPQVRIVDVTHAITPFQAREAAFVLCQFYPFYPEGSIHVVVVDPGVGSARKPLLVEAAGQCFIGPDNGMFSMLYQRAGPYTVRELTRETYWRQPVSRTFHGRDLFAPVAAHLAQGVLPEDLGPIYEAPLRSSFGRPVQTGRRFFTGEVVKVDHFGNLITNFHREDFPAMLERPFEFHIGADTLTELADTFAEIPAGEARIISGSSGYFEVVANQASAAKLLGCGPGSPIELAQY